MNTTTRIFIVFSSSTATYARSPGVYSRSRVAAAAYHGGAARAQATAEACVCAGDCYAANAFYRRVPSSSESERHREPRMVDKPRAHPRYEIDAYVDVTGGDVSEVLLYHRIQNISLGGICIQTATLAEVGSPVDVVINFPDLGAQLQLRGQVAWANRHPPQDVGIRWVSLDEERREMLKKYISLVKTREISGPGASNSNA